MRKTTKTKQAYIICMTKRKWSHKPQWELHAWHYSNIYHYQHRSQLSTPIKVQSRKLITCRAKKWLLLVVFRCFLL